MKENTKLRLFSYFVIAYMLLAFAWWSVLLFEKNRDAFKAWNKYQRVLMVAEGKVSSDAEYRQTAEYQELASDYKTQEWMIMGEALFFVLSLVTGIWLINRGYHKEVMAARQRRNFLLSITHELKSPIASIKLVLETLIRRKTLKLEQAEKLHQSALKEVDRLHTLVNDLLLSARLETSYTLNIEKINLKKLIDELCSKMLMEQPSLQVSFRTNLDEAMLNGDKTGLTSVVLNLMENAAKYSGDEKIIDVTLENTSDSWIVKIADQGIGISEIEKKNIFEKFYRVGNEDTRKTKGTGLGLYIVDQIVKAHKGHIEVLDNEPRGTVFVVSLPKGRALTKDQAFASEMAAATEV